MRTIEEIKVDMQKPCDYTDKCEFEYELRNALIFDIPLDRLEEICNAESDGRLTVLPDKWLETLKLLTISAICYQNWNDTIISEMRNSKDIQGLFLRLPTVQYASNRIRLLRLEKSGLDVNALTSINEVVDIMYPKEPPESAQEALKRRETE